MKGETLEVGLPVGKRRLAVFGEEEGRVGQPSLDDPLVAGSDPALRIIGPVHQGQEMGQQRPLLLN